jgi:hypothetical protein
MPPGYASQLGINERNQFGERPFIPLPQAAINWLRFQGPSPVMTSAAFKKDFLRWRRCARGEPLRWKGLDANARSAAEGIT